MNRTNEQKEIAICNIYKQAKAQIREVLGEDVQVGCTIFKAPEELMIDDTGKKVALKRFFNSGKRDFTALTLIK